jgi:hypothetical protein
MPDSNDESLLKAAVRLGFLKEEEARKAFKKAARTREKPVQWLVDRGILTPREVERIRRASGLGRPPTRRGTRRGAPVERRSHGGLWFALIGFVVVLAAGLFMFKDRIFTEDSTPPDTLDTLKERDVAGASTPDKKAPDTPDPARAPDSGTGPIPGPEAGEDPRAPAPAPGDRPDRPARDAPHAKETTTPADDESEPPPRATRRDEKLRKAGDAAFDRGEKLNEQVARTEGKERAELMENALEAYTEALVKYRAYSGEHVPAFLEKRYVEVNSRIAWLRKLMPPERAAKYIDRLTGRGATAADLLVQAESAHSRSPLDYTRNYMMFQRILDEHPDSREAIQALRRIGEIGWLEVKSLTTRGEFMGEVAKWKKAMRAGDFESVRRGLRTVQTDTVMRRAMKKGEWEWYQAAERALRVPKAAMEKIFRGQTIQFRRRGGSLVKGQVSGTTESGIRFSDGRVVRISRVHPEDVIRLAYGKKLNGSKYLTAACFLAFSGHGDPALEAFEKAKKWGVPVEDYETPIHRLRYESKKNNR